MPLVWGRRCVPIRLFAPQALLQRGVDVASSLAADHRHVGNLDKMIRR